MITPLQRVQNGLAQCVSDSPNVQFPPFPSPYASSGTSANNSLKQAQDALNGIISNINDGSSGTISSLNAIEAQIYSTKTTVNNAYSYATRGGRGIANPSSSLINFWNKINVLSSDFAELISAAQSQQCDSESFDTSYKASHKPPVQTDTQGSTNTQIFYIILWVVGGIILTAILVSFTIFIVDNFWHTNKNIPTKVIKK